MLLTQKLISQDIINPDYEEIYKTGIKLVLSDILNVALVLFIGVITYSFAYSCIYLITFWTVRRFSGGFHAKTYGFCRVITVGIYILVLLVSRIITQHYIIYTIIFDIITVLTVILYAPIQHQNKELTIVEIKANKLVSILITFLISIVSLISTIFKKEMGIIISLTLFAIAVLMYTALINSRKEEL